MQETKWDKEWFIFATENRIKKKIPKKSKPSDLEVQLAALKRLEKALHIREPRDWGCVTKHQIMKHKCSILLVRNKSLKKALKNLLPG